MLEYAAISRPIASMNSRDSEKVLSMAARQLSEPPRSSGFGRFRGGDVRSQRRLRPGVTRTPQWALADAEDRAAGNVQYGSRDRSGLVGGGKNHCIGKLLQGWEAAEQGAAIHP